MKKIVFAFVSLLALPAFAADVRPYEFEVVPGCIWTKSEGQCIVSNRFQADITCKVTTKGVTTRGLKIGNSRTSVIGAGRYDGNFRVVVPEGDSLTTLSASADCKAE